MTAVDRLFGWKFGGFRVIEIFGAALVAALIASVYVAKAGADRENRQIASLESKIADDSRRVRLLRAEIARLEQPERLEALSRHAGLAPVDVHRQASADSLPSIAGPTDATPAPTTEAVAPQPAVVPPEAPQ